MKRIFGITFIEKKDFADFKAEVWREVAHGREMIAETTANTVRTAIGRADKRCNDHETKVAAAIDFIFRHLPMKRYRKELRNRMESLEAHTTPEP